MAGMEYILPGIAVALLGLVLALLLKQRKGGGAVEGELRTRIDTLQDEAAGLRADLDAQRQARVQAETRLEAERENLEEQRRLLADAEAQLKDAFAALSAKALKEGREQFLDQAGERLKPIRQTLDAYQKRLEEIEKARNDAYGGLRSYLDTLREANEGLRKQAHELSTALRASPTARGRWGEVTLRRVVEVAGMSPHCDFDEQASQQTEDGRRRPDMLIRLPNERVIVVDSKVPLDAYMRAVEAADDAARAAALVRHARHVRDRMVQLGQNAYASHIEQSPDFVVLFLPLEAAFSAALEQDRGLIEDGMASGVVLATPTTLIALLKAVHYGWRQQEMAENAQRIGETGRQLYERLCVFLEHFAKVGGELDGALKAYNDAVGSFERRVRPSAQRLAAQSAAGRDLPEPDRLETPLRSLPEPEDLPEAAQDAEEG
jgi:DNA recombination protein RmuC